MRMQTGDGIMYFDNVASQITSKSISPICQPFSKMVELSKAAQQVYCDCRCITADWRVLEGVLELLRSTVSIYGNRQSDTTSIVYQRCIEKLQQSHVEKDDLFDLMVDCCWMVASEEYCRKNRTETLSLLSTPIQIRICLKQALSELYQTALQNGSEYAYIEEAIAARNRIFTGLYPFKYIGSHKYISRDYTTERLEIMMDNYRNTCVNQMAAFFALTVTGIRAWEIRREII